MQYQNTLLGKPIATHRIYGIERYKKYCQSVGHLRGGSARQVFPIGEDGGSIDEQSLTERVNCLTSRYYKDEKENLIQMNNPSHSNNRIFNPKGISPALNTVQGGNRQPKIQINHIGNLNVIATKRAFDTPKEINIYLKEKKCGITINEIASTLNIPKTQVEHYFRCDDSRAVPSPEIWMKLKALFGFGDEYDAVVVSVFEKEVEFESSRRIFDSTGLSPTLDSTTNGKIISIPYIAGCLTGGGHSGGMHSDMTAIPVLTPDRPEKRQNGRRFKDDGDPMFTLTGQDKHGVMLGHSRGKDGVATYHSVDVAGTVKQPSGNQCNYFQTDVRIRRLTPTECARLQGFPDDWAVGSDTQKYKQYGNAVTVNVIEAIVKKIVEREVCVCP